jgi:hypothetical protein
MFLTSEKKFFGLPVEGADECHNEQQDGCDQGKDKVGPR